MKAVGKTVNLCTFGDCDFKPPAPRPRPSNGPGGWGQPANGDTAWGGPNQKVPSKGLNAGAKRQTYAIIRDLERPKAQRQVHGITRQNLKPSRTTKRGNTRDLKRRGSKIPLRIRTDTTRKRSAANRRDGRRASAKDRRSRRNVEQRRDRRSSKSRRGRRG